MIDIEKCIAEFNNYVNNYDINNPKINRKYYHSFKVADLCERIALSLNLKEEDILLAKKIGLLHDIGRFEQATIYDTYDDSESVDHAILGVQILSQNNYISKYISDKEDQKVALIAITNHNCFKIEAELTDHEQLFSKIIRDADKIDIYRVIIEENYYNINDGKPSKKVIEAILNNKCVDKIDIKTMIDELICSFGFVFDINYKDSFKTIIENNYISKLYYNSLQYYGDYEEILLSIKNEIEKYINKRMEEIKC